MIRALQILFAAILVVMIATTTWATLQSSVFTGGSAVLESRWGIATLLDAYCGFLTFFVWVAWRERATGVRILWFVLIMTLGNIAMASYMLIQLFRLPAGASIRDLLVGREGAS
ncbi:MAG: DUF1475 family protein [Acidobacteriota bacterium]